MKLQGVAVVFALIVLPIIMILSLYLGYNIDTIALQTSYDTKLLDATFDAVSAIEINTANEDLSSVEIDILLKIVCDFDSQKEKFNYNNAFKSIAQIASRFITQAQLNKNGSLIPANAKSMPLLIQQVLFYMAVAGKEYNLYTQTDIVDILSLPYWDLNMYKHLLTPTMYNKNAKQIQEILELPYWRDLRFFPLLTPSVFSRTAKGISDIFELPYWNNPRYNSLLCSSIYMRSAREITEMIEYCNNNGLGFLSKNPRVVLQLNLEQFIQKFLSDKYDCVTLPWVNYSDNDIVYHIDKPIQELYTKPSTKISHKDWDNTIHHCGKSIFQCRVGVQSNAHNPEPWYEFNILTLTREDGFVRHYRTKCLEDYLEHKVKCQNFSNVSICKSNIIDFYFQINDYTKDKVLYINKWVRKNNFMLSDVDVATIYTLNKLFLITEEMINED